MGRISRAGAVGAITALVAAVACAPASAGPWVGEYAVVVGHADQGGSGTWHQDSSGACTSSVDGSGNEQVHLLGGAQSMTVTGVELGPGSSHASQLGVVPLLQPGGSIARSGKTTSTPDPHPCAGGGGSGSSSPAPPPDCGTKPATGMFSLIPQSDGTLRWGPALGIAQLKDPFQHCPSFVEHAFPSVLPVTLRYNPNEFGLGQSPKLRGVTVNPFSAGGFQGLERADVELRLIPRFITPALSLGSRSAEERIDGRGSMTASVACPRAGACKGTLSVAYGPGAEPVVPAAPATAAGAGATAARVKRARYPAPLKTGPLVSSLKLGSVKFSLRRGQHKRITLRLTKHSRGDLAQFKGVQLGLVVSQQRRKAKLAYLIGTARTG
ncbi:MAG: hypothetical protein QOF17_1276 [Solirubrobacteraceae bacterium]|nr:hypothetical protein [Solirubrobacteraceae bacterium]